MKLNMIFLAKVEKIPYICFMNDLTTYTDIKNETNCCGVIYVTATAKYPNGKTMVCTMRKSDVLLSNHLAKLSEKYKMDKNDLSELKELINNDSSQIIYENQID